MRDCKWSSVFLLNVIWRTHLGWPWCREMYSRSHANRSAMNCWVTSSRLPAVSSIYWKSCDGDSTAPRLPTSYLMFSESSSPLWPTQRNRILHQPLLLRLHSISRSTVVQADSQSHAWYPSRILHGLIVTLRVWKNFWTREGSQIATTVVLLVTTFRKMPKAFLIRNEP